MFRSSILFFFIFGIINFAHAEFTIPEQVNNRTSGIQANRDGDTPWGIAVDDSNVHIVFESKAPFGDHTLDIHYRVLNFVRWQWQNEEPVTKEETYDHSHFGHPSIIFNEDLECLVSYVIDAPGWRRFS